MARRYKDIIDPFYFQRLAEVESSNNPNAEASTSSATGLYQFTKGTWKGLVDQLGLDYTLEDRKDPEKALKVVKEFTKQNRNYLKNRLGKEPNRAELYISHFLGMGGGSKLLSQLQKNPNATVDTVATQAQINANRNVFLNKDGSLKKVKDIYNWSAKKFEEDPYDDAIYSYDQEGNVTNIDPKTATPQQKERSKEIKKNFYSEKSQQAIKELKFQNDMLTDPFAFVQPPPQQKEAPKEQQPQQEQKTEEPPQYVEQQQPAERQPITQSLPSEAYEFYTPQENEFLQYFLQEGGENPKEYKSKDFFQDYLSSDIYLDRLRKQGWKMPELIRDTRLDKLRNMEAYVGNYGDEMGSTYLPYNNSLMVNVDEVKKYGDDINTVLAHETSHGLGARQHEPNHVMRLNRNETTEINQRNKDKSIEHDGRAHELKADIDALRYKMFEDGIYDTTKGDVNKEQIQKAKSKYKNNTFIKRVFDRLSDDDLIYLMNNIATTDESDNNFYGQEGGQLTEKEIDDINSFIEKDFK